MPLSSLDVGKLLPEQSFNWVERDVILYALAVGGGSDFLPFVYEGKGPLVLPTFGVVPAFPALAGGIGTLDFDRRMTLHGSHSLELHRPIPASGKVVTRSEIVNVWDKGRDAVITARSESTTGDGQLLFTNVFSAFVRGAGGFGGERGDDGERELPLNRDPDQIIELPTSRDQALLYRLCGDWNPLHADPDVATAAGFPKPILHGLCTFGLVGRGILGQFCGYDPSEFRSLSARFTGVVFPGETVVVHCWDEGSRIRFIASTKERVGLVLDKGELKRNSA